MTVPPGEPPVPPPPTGTTWLEAQRRYIEDFGRRMDTSWAATQDFWKHLVVVEATVLGLTVGFIGAWEHQPPMTLILSWVALLLAIAAGSVLVKIGIDINFDGVLRGFRFQSDVAGIMARVEANELSTASEEYQGLFTAAALQMPPDAVAQQIFTPRAKELATRYAGQLPTSPLFNMPRRTPVARWLHAHWQGIETAFYALSIVAFALLVASVAARSPSAHSTPPSIHAAAPPIAAPDSTKLKKPSLPPADSLPHKPAAGASQESTHAAQRDSSKTTPKTSKPGKPKTTRS